MSESHESIYSEFSKDRFRKDIFFYYNGILKDKIKEFKFQDSTYLKKPLSSILYDALDKELLKTIDYITFVPSSNKKKKVKGYNHSELLAVEISKLSKIPIFFEFYKVKNTKSQHFLSLEERSVNLINSFEVKGCLKGKNILLVDDIHTSGATIKECYNELNRADCNFVWAICICGVI